VHVQSTYIHTLYYIYMLVESVTVTYRLRDKARTGRAAGAGAFYVPRTRTYAPPVYIFLVLLALAPRHIDVEVRDEGHTTTYYDTTIHDIWHARHIFTSYMSARASGAGR